MEKDENQTGYTLENGNMDRFRSQMKLWRSSQDWLPQK